MIVVPPPGVGQHLRLRHTRKDLTVKQFISELTIEAFDVAVLPGAARQVVARDNLRDAMLRKLDSPTVEALWRV